MDPHKTKEELDRAVPFHTLLDVSASKSKALLAHKGTLGQRHRPSADALRASVMRRSVSTASNFSSSYHTPCESVEESREATPDSDSGYVISTVTTTTTSSSTSSTPTPNQSNKQSPSPPQTDPLAQKVSLLAELQNRKVKAPNDAAGQVNSSQSPPKDDGEPIINPFKALKPVGFNSKKTIPEIPIAQPLIPTLRSMRTNDSSSSKTSPPNDDDEPVVNPFKVLKPVSFNKKRPAPQPPVVQATTSNLKTKSVKECPSISNSIHSPPKDDEEPTVNPFKVLKPVGFNTRRGLPDETPAQALPQTIKLKSTSVAFNSNSSPEKDDSELVFSPFKVLKPTSSNPKRVIPLATSTAEPSLADQLKARLDRRRRSLEESEENLEASATQNVTQSVTQNGTKSAQDTDKKVSEGTSLFRTPSRIFQGIAAVALSQKDWNQAVIKPEGPVEDWSTENVCQWLNDSGNDSFKTLFSDKSINGSLLLTLDSGSGLKDFGVKSKEDRDRMKKKIKDLKTQNDKEKKEAGKKEKLLKKGQDKETKKK